MRALTARPDQTPKRHEGMTTLDSAMKSNKPKQSCNPMRSGFSLLGVSVAMLLAPMPDAKAATEKEELLKLRNTTLNLIDMLVEQGVLDKDKASAMVKKAEKKAEVEAKEEAQGGEGQGQATTGLVGGAAVVGAQAPAVADTGSRVSLKNVDGQPAAAKGPVRVTYVPDFVKDEIRADIRKELQDEVVKQVKADAKNEKWGIPGALPEWISKIRPFGDVRLRFEDQLFGSNNVENAYYNWPLINKNGGLQNTPNPYLNTTQDRDRFRARVRFGFENELVEGAKMNVRMSTTNEYSPITTNQSYSNMSSGWMVQLDRAFLQYDFLDDEGYDWFSLWGGRTPNPWFSTDNIFDQDLNFDGFSGTFRVPFGELNDPELRGYNAPNTAGRLWFQSMNMGFTKPNEFYLTGGFFPLQETPFEPQSKWMAAGQLGYDWLFYHNNRMKTGVAYYSYHNTQARRNPLGSTQYDWTAPQFFTQGNSLAEISNDLEPENAPRLVGLASKFDVLDVIAQYDYTGFAPNHVLLTGNYTKNLGFNQEQIYNSLGVDLQPQTTAYQIRLDVGRPDLLLLGDWNAYVAYKYLERDSTLDAWADSNFHLSGTNARGYAIGANYGFAKNIWANIRWLSSGVITGPTYDVDVLLADINARF